MNNIYFMREGEQLILLLISCLLLIGQSQIFCLACAYFSSLY